ncbi:hypothetical protein PHLCEN_2v5259 [Hermanssonia centrifuga]|uniref:Uncharacterized protein n=1 Tax=Hermanssonia centrifuga TaxID=98765 RepID=A0A2R6P8J6_9APHY|nr:hypothetical protein PHLCEN_2v5259 [Hermanssonia centrifuga]
MSFLMGRYNFSFAKTSRLRCIQDAGHLVKDLWPTGLPKVSKDPSSMDEIPTRDRVPEDEKAMVKWAYVRKLLESKDPSRRHALVYVDQEEGHNGLEQVAVRLQGFVSSCDISPLGNWKLTDASAPKAVQFLVLTAPADVTDVMHAQNRGLGRIRELIYRALQSGKTGMEVKDEIYLQSRVFTKVRAGSSIKSILQPRDDPSGEARALEKRWIVEHRVITGVQSEDGKILPASHRVIRKGDFVDVLVVPEIASYSSDCGREFQVHFTIKRVIRLKGRENLIESISYEMVHNNAHLPSPRHCELYTFRFLNTLIASIYSIMIPNRTVVSNKATSEVLASEVNKAEQAVGGGTPGKNETGHVVDS